MQQGLFVGSGGVLAAREMGRVALVILPFVGV